MTVPLTADPGVMTTVGGWVAVLLALGLTATVTIAASRVGRLDRLHRRMDAARAALDAALTRRVRAAAAAGVPGTAPGGSWTDRETAANELGRRLAALSRATLAPAVRAELTEAEQMLALARRVHNDAVRDTLTLRSLRMVGWLHLAGTAPMPAYFEIVDPPVLGAMRETPIGPATRG